MAESGHSLHPNMDENSLSAFIKYVSLNSLQMSIPLLMLTQLLNLEILREPTKLDNEHSNLKLDKGECS